MWAEQKRLSVGSTNTSTVSALASTPPPSSLQSLCPPSVCQDVLVSDSVPFSPSPASPPSLPVFIQRNLYARLAKHAPDVYITQSPSEMQTCRIERHLYLISVTQKFQRADRMTGSEGGRAQGRQERGRED